MRVRCSITPEPVHSGNGLVQNATRSRGGTDSETDISHLPETAETVTQPVSLGPVPGCSYYTNRFSMGTLLQVDHPACLTTPEGAALLTPPPTVRTRTEFARIGDLIAAEQALLLYSVLGDAGAPKKSTITRRRSVEKSGNGPGKSLKRSGRSWFGLAKNSASSTSCASITSREKPKRRPCACRSTPTALRIRRHPPPVRPLPQTDSDNDLPITPAAQYE